MNELIEKENIKDMIYEIRGKQVMLDSDLAKLYGCKNGTKTINLAVKRNIDRFPEDFYFKLTENEIKSNKQLCSRFQIETLNKNRGQNLKYLPYVFTEQGVAMLTSVLKTEVASKVSVDIMRAFVEMRHFIINNGNLFNRMNVVESKLLQCDNKINLILEQFGFTAKS